MSRRTKKTNVSVMTSRKRLVFFFAIVIVLFIVLAIRLGQIQIINADEYSSRALEQQTRDVPITAKRGNIYDINGKPLAINQSMNTIWVRPAEVAEREKKEEGYTQQMASVLAGILDNLTEEEIYETITSDTSLLRLQKYVDDEKTELVREAVSDGTVTGLQISETVKRYYPMGAFASHVIGSTNDDNNGMSGIELYYDKYLTGTQGRWIKNTDASGRNLTNGIEKYYAAENGLNLVMTIDEVIQHYVESALEQVQLDTNAERAMAIVMEPSTGYVLAMACYPDFDLNDPRTPLSESEQEALEGMSDEEKVEYWNEMWRNPLVNDTYEPGSPFKLVTTSIALEEGLTSVNDSFYCAGSLNIAGTKLSCWRSYNPHGAETLAQGVANSCNPVFVTLSQRIGIDKYYEYLEQYGLMDNTGIDYPGEASAILQSKSSAGPVGLATISYGQGIALTPIQVITVLSSLGNGGKLMQPHLVRELTDDEGNTVEEFEPTVVRQVVSQQTADDICMMMEGVVSHGTGSAAYLPGYRVGGKTGTAQKVVDGKYTENTYSSFFAMAPMDDPQVAVLVIVDSPQGVHYGSQTAGPGAKSILSNVLKYLKVEPVYTDEEKAEAETDVVTVPDLIGKSYASAAETLRKLGLTAIACPSGNEDFEVIDQYPKGGTELAAGNSVCLYSQ